MMCKPGNYYGPEGGPWSFTRSVLTNALIGKSGLAAFGDQIDDSLSPLKSLDIKRVFRSARKLLNLLA
jgi:hypothetical protein